MEHKWDKPVEVRTEYNGIVMRLFFKKEQADARATRFPQVVYVAPFDTGYIILDRANDLAYDCAGKLPGSIQNYIKG